MASTGQGSVDLPSRSRYPAVRRSSASRSQTRMFAAGTPAARSPSMMASTTARCVAPDGPPVAEILMPTTSFGSTRLRQPAATLSRPRDGQDEPVHHLAHAAVVGDVCRDGKRVADGENLRTRGGLRRRPAPAVGGGVPATGVGVGVGWSMPARAAAAANGVSGVSSRAKRPRVMPGGRLLDAAPSHKPATAINARAAAFDFS